MAAHFGMLAVGLLGHHFLVLHQLSLRVQERGLAFWARYRYLHIKQNHGPHINGVHPPS